MTVPRALVTGGTGFLGGHLADALARAGYQVRTLDVIRPSARRAENHEFVEADIRDRDAVRRAARGCDVVVDNAALVPVSRSSLAEYREVNVTGCANTVDAAEAEGAYLVHISSSAIYGIPKMLPVTLETPVAPVETYGQSKAEAEALVEGRRRDGFPIASLRPRALLGPGRLGIFDLMFGRIRAGKRVPLLGAGNTVQLCHVDDFCRATLAVIGQRSNGTYNIAAEEFSTRIRDDLEQMIERVGTGAKVQPVPVVAARVLLPPLAVLGLLPFTAWHWRAAPASFWCDVSDAKRELGWGPRYSNVDALVDSYEHYLTRSASDGDGSPHSRPLEGLLARLLRG
jgi:nucleoside-diphosphate-sugar epimerase